MRQRHLFVVYFSNLVLYIPYIWDKHSPPGLLELQYGKICSVHILHPLPSRRVSPCKAMGS